MGSGLILRKLGPWLLACDLLPLVGVLGAMVVVIESTLWLVALLLLLLLFFPARFSLVDGLLLILRLGLSFDCCRWTCSVTQVVQRSLLWPASWLPAVDKGRRSTSVEVQRVWEVYDERLHFVSRQDALQLDESLAADDVSRAWLVWSRAAEAALADAYRFSGGPLPSRGLLVGRSSASFRVVRLGGHPLRKARGNAADAHDAADVFLCRDSSIAPLA